MAIDREDAIIVDLRNISVGFNNKSVLKDVNLSIKQNDFLAIVGPNGGGKTTLLRIILGLVKPTRGTVKVFGHDPVIGRKFIGYLPQYSLFDLEFPINVFDAVLMGRYGRIFRNYSNDDKEIAINALRTVGILDLKGRQIGTLSGGQLQRVFIARALVRKPKLLVLDEPMTSIDPEMQKSFYELLSKLKKQMAIVLVTHDIGAVSVYVDKIACLNRELFYHGLLESGIKKLEETYKCPIELIAHGIPHRVLRKHNNEAS